ncbi:hypothetical protein ABPG75_010304 [Micractinium tetrahymenae]
MQMHFAAVTTIGPRPVGWLLHQRREQHGRGVARRAFRGAPPGGSSWLTIGGTWLEEGSGFLSDLKSGYECAAAWHAPGLDPAQPPQPNARLAPAQRSGGPACPAAHSLMSPSDARGFADRAAEEDMEGMSDQEDWVFGSCCEAAACWCQEADAASCEAPGAAPAEPAAPADDASARQEGDGEDGSAMESFEWGLFDSGSYPASAAITQDYSHGDCMAGIPEEEQLRSRGSVLASVDGMVGNWEMLGHGGSGSDDTGLAASDDYADLLAQLQQLEACAGRSGRAVKAAAAASASNASCEAGEGPGMKGRE